MTFQTNAREFRMNKAYVNSNQDITDYIYNSINQMNNIYTIFSNIFYGF